MHVIHFMHELAGCLYMYYIIFKIADWLPLPGIQNLKADFEGNYSGQTTIKICF